MGDRELLRDRKVTRYRMFTGKEVEGCNAGRHTLFVEGLASAQDIIRAARHHKVTQIYFGANYMPPTKSTPIQRPPSAFSLNTIWRVVEDVASGNVGVRWSERNVVTLDCTQENALKVIKSGKWQVENLEFMISLASMEEIEPRLLKQTQAYTGNIQLKFPYREGVIVVPMRAVSPTIWEEYKKAGDKLL